MTKTENRLAALLAALGVALSLTVPAWAAGSSAVDRAVADTAQFVYAAVPEPQVGSAGGEWAILGLARSDFNLPEEYCQRYYEAVERQVRECGGVLHERKYTEYSRVITALSALGRDAREVAGYDLTKPLGDFDKTVWQGVNGPIWALIALDCRNYPMPQDPQAQTQATRQMYVDYILSRQLPDGGWSLRGTGDSDPDLTGMALQALAKYQDQPQVDQAIRRALDCVSVQQDPTGGFAGWGTDNVESCAQVIVALCELGIPLDDPRFVKEGNLQDKLLSFCTPDSGFLHTQDGAGVSQIATEQALYALAALQRAQNGQSSLYRMGDVEAPGGSAPSEPLQPGPEALVRQALLQLLALAGLR